MHTDHKRGERITGAGRLIARVILFLVPYFYLTLSFCVVLFIHGRTNDAITQYYARRWPTAYDAETLMSAYGLHGWYAWVRDHYVWLVLLLITFLWVYLVLSRRVWRFLGRLLDELGLILGMLRRTFIDACTREKIWIILLFAAILLYRIYFFLIDPLSTDETFSYLFHARQGLVLTATTYPAPNNHIFFNLACSILYKTHLFSAKALMRLPSMIGDMILFYGIFCLFRLSGRPWRPLVTVAGTAFCFLISFYATNGRGYQWQEICLVTALLGCWHCFYGGFRVFGEKQKPPPGSLFQGQGQVGSAVFVIASVIGWYINPLFVYPFLGLAFFFGYLFLRQRRYRDLVLFLKYVAWIAVLAALLYLPMILFMGWKNIFMNDQMSGFSSWKEMGAGFNYFAYEFTQLTGYSGLREYLLGALLLIPLFLYMGGRLRGGSMGRYYEHATVYVFASLLAILLLTLVKRVYPVVRGLVYWELILNIIFVNLVADGFRAYFGSASRIWIPLFLTVKIGGGLRLLYLDKNFYRIQYRQSTIGKVLIDLDALAALHPKTWQITDSDDFYSMYITLKLDEGGQGRIIFDRHQALGDVLFVPDTYEGRMSLGNYALWAGHKITVKGKYLDIYVTKALLQSPH